MYTQKKNNIVQSQTLGDLVEFDICKAGRPVTEGNMIRSAKIQKSD